MSRFNKIIISALVALLIAALLASVIAPIVVGENLAATKPEMNGPVVSAHHHAEFRYAGQYAGPYSVKSSTFGDQTGKFTLSIDQAGKVTGKAENNTISKTATLSGSVNSAGKINLVLEWPDTTYTLKGSVVKTKKGHLKGTLSQYTGKQIIATIRMDLSRSTK